MDPNNFKSSDRGKKDYFAVFRFIGTCPNHVNGGNFITMNQSLNEYMDDQPMFVGKRLNHVFAADKQNKFFTGICQRLYLNYQGKYLILHNSDKLNSRLSPIIDRLYSQILLSVQTITTFN